MDITFLSTAENFLVYSQANKTEKTNKNSKKTMFNFSFFKR
jgi:hypothetical protein